MPTRADYGNRQEHTTTVTIPGECAKFVAQSGMTFSGAFVQGIKAIAERKERNEYIGKLEDNIRRAHARIGDMYDEIVELRKRLEANK